MRSWDGGLVGQYLSGEVAREFLVRANQLSLAGRLSFYQDFELDSNRDWRCDAAGEKQTLGRLNALLEYRPRSALRCYGSLYILRRLDLAWLYSHSSGDVVAGRQGLVRLAHRW